MIDIQNQPIQFLRFKYCLFVMSAMYCLVFYCIKKGLNLTLLYGSTWPVIQCEILYNNHSIPHQIITFQLKTRSI